MEAAGQDAGYQGPHLVTIKHNHLTLAPFGGAAAKVRLDSPRFQQSLGECGVLLDDLYPVTDVKQLTKPGCERGMFTEVAHVRLAAYERDRLAHLDAVLRHREQLVAGTKAKGSKRGEMGEAEVESSSSMIAKIAEDVAAEEERRKRRLEANERMVAENERIMAENAAAQARRDAELEARQEAGRQAMIAKGEAAAEKVRKRDERIRLEKERAEAREKQSLIEQDEQLAAFEAQRQRFIARRRQQQRDTERKNADKVARKERNQARRQREKDEEGARRAELMRQRQERLANNRRKYQEELEAKNEAQRQLAQARMDDDAKKAVQRLQDQWDAFETKQRDLKQRQADKAAADAEARRVANEEEAAAKAKAQVSATAYPQRLLSLDCVAHSDALRSRRRGTRSSGR